MKRPKVTNRFCPFCNEKTEHKVKLLSTGSKRGSLKRGGIPRARLRGLGVGFGNKGKWGSKPPVSKWKRKTKNTKKAVFVYTCSKCKKSHNSKKGKRTGKVIME
ncbi:MAG: 50S ribosomal protein L44e [Candidatus Pacearchaeota archaeon]